MSSNAESIRTEVEALFTKSPQARELSLDLRSARLIDSVGLNLIVTFIRRIKQHGGKANITVGHPTVRRMMAFTRIDQHAQVEMD